MVVIVCSSRPPRKPLLICVRTERQFPVTLLKTPSQSRISLGPCKLYVQGQWLCFTSNPPPRVLATWNVNDLRRFGLIEGHFCFEAGARCGKQGEQPLHVSLPALQR